MFKFYFIKTSMIGRRTESATGRAGTEHGERSALASMGLGVRGKTQEACAVTPSTAPVGELYEVLVIQIKI